MFEVIPSLGKPIKAWTIGVPVEEEAKQQLRNLASLPFVHKHIAVMPDVHFGKGATVGSVIATKGAIVPAAVGVDIGCGMIAQKLSLKAKDLPDNLHALRSAIEAAVPHGRTDNGGVNDRGAWGEIPKTVNNAFGTRLVNSPMRDGLYRICTKFPDLIKSAKRSRNQLGTLGGGNHFIEICLDENQDVWIMLHSGSRGIGNRIGTTFIDLAKKDMERFFINLPDKDLAYIPEGSELFEDYWYALEWAQNYARVNRELMMEAVQYAIIRELKTDLKIVGGQAVNCHHNYVSRENHFGANVLVTRKGAVRAREGDLGIIPGSMGAKSFIVRGKGNNDSFHSCSHGAGRAMSRTQAKKQFSIEDHAKAMEGVEARLDADIVDETPGAYKSIEAVMAAQSDLVDIVHALKQVLVVKG